MTEQWSEKVRGVKYILEEPHRLKLIKFEAEIQGEKDVMSRTVLSAISPGTELAAFKGSRSLSGKHIYPRLVGYCNVSEVLKVGSSVSLYDVGDLILTTGSHQSVLVSNEKDILYKFQDGDVATEVVCSYLYHLGYNAVLKTDIVAGSRVCVIGLGVLGLTSVEMCSIAGANTTAISELEHQSNLAENLGAIFSFKRKIAKEKKQLFDSFDVVILTTNQWADFELALQLCCMHGKIACLGFPGRDMHPGTFNPLDSRYFYYKQLSIMSVGFSPKFNDDRGFLRFNEKDNISFINSLIKRKKIDPNIIITDTLPFENLEVIYRRLIERNPKDQTFLLKWTD